MSNPVILSVDGLPGLDGAASRDAHFVTPDAGQQDSLVSFARYQRVILGFLTNGC